MARVQKVIIEVGSDIDLTIKGHLLPFFEFLQIEDQVDGLYLPYMVDLSQYEKLTNNDLIAHIDRVGVNIYTHDTSNFRFQYKNRTSGQA